LPSLRGYMTSTAVEIIATDTRSEPRDLSALHVPLGLLGFEELKEFRLVGNAEHEPFLWLQVRDDPTLAFLVAPPLSIVNDYRPSVAPDDVQFLGLTDVGSALLLNIVTLRADGRATVNLKGPIVINARTRIGKQIIPLNAADYSVHHPLPVVS